MRTLTETAGDGLAIDLLRADVDVASRVDANVLITGGQAVQNEWIARVVHHQGHHASGPFVSVGCASLRDAQLASLLFHGSDGGNGGPAALARAAGGTLFLASIDGLTMQSQTRLMRLLDEAAGPSSAPPGLPLDSRIICSTERGLNDAVLAGTFLENLYYRLNTVCLKVPPLTGEEWESCSTTLAGWPVASTGRTPKRPGSHRVDAHPGHLRLQLPRR